MANRVIDRQDTNQTESSIGAMIGMEGGTGGQGHDLMYLQNVQQISRQLEDLRTKVLFTVTEQLKQFERERSVQLESHCEAMAKMLQDHCKQLSFRTSAGEPKMNSSRQIDGNAEKYSNVSNSPVYGNDAGSPRKGSKDSMSEGSRKGSKENQVRQISMTSGTSDISQCEIPSKSPSQAPPSNSSSSTAWDSAFSYKGREIRWGKKEYTSPERGAKSETAPVHATKTETALQDLSGDDQDAIVHIKPPVAAPAPGDPSPPTASGLPMLFNNPAPLMQDAPSLPNEMMEDAEEDTRQFCQVVPVADDDWERRGPDSSNAVMVVSTSTESSASRVGPLDDQHDPKPILKKSWTASKSVDFSMENGSIICPEDDEAEEDDEELGPGGEVAAITSDSGEKPRLKKSMSQASLQQKIPNSKEDDPHQGGMTLWKRTQTLQEEERRNKELRFDSETNGGNGGTEKAPRTTAWSQSSRAKTMRSEEGDPNERKCERFVRRIVQSKKFGGVILFAIIANSCFIGIQTQAMWNLEIECYKNLGECDKSFWGYKVGEILFTLIFTFELTLRYIDLGPYPWLARPKGRLWHFFRGPDWAWNLFDLSLVCTSILDLIFMVWQKDSDALSFIKMLRVIRLTRIARVIRTLRFFRSLRLMLHSIMNSVSEVLWVFVVLAILLFVVAIYLEVVVIDHFESHSIKDSKEYRHEFLIENFGGIYKTMVSLFMSISGGRDWHEFFVALDSINYFSGWAFIIYIFFVVFGVLNVVTGAFVDSMRLVSQRDNDLVIEQEIKREIEFKNEVKSIFEEADADGSGTLSWDEFESHLQNERVRAYFTSLELDISEARALFVLLDVEETDEVPIEKFISGCLRMRGDAKSIDVNMILYENEKMLCKLTSFTEYAEEMFDRLDKSIGDVRRRVKNIEVDCGNMNYGSEQSQRTSDGGRSQDKRRNNAVALDPGAVEDLMKPRNSGEGLKGKSGTQTMSSEASMGLPMTAAASNASSKAPKAKPQQHQGRGSKGPASRLEAAMSAFESSDQYGGIAGDATRRGSADARIEAALAKPTAGGRLGHAIETISKAEDDIDFYSTTIRGGIAGSTRDSIFFNPARESIKSKDGKPSAGK